MNNVVIPFVAPTQRNAQRNIKAFIIFVQKNAIYFHGPNAVQWNDMKWDLTPFMPKRANTKTIAIFSTEAYGKEPFPQPFYDQAKAMIANQLRTSRSAQVSGHLGVIRVLYKALKQANLPPSIEHLNDHVLSIAGEIIAEKGDAWKAGRTLEGFIHDHIEAGRLSAVPLTWTNPFKWKKPKRSNMVNAKSERKGETYKLPHIKCILDLASVFQNPTSHSDTVTTAWFALSMFAPSRVGEITTLPTACITHGDDEGEPILGLSWLPEKGGAAMTKWATSPGWEELAVEAVTRLSELGKSARTAAEWYEENPDQLYLPPGYEHLRGNRLSREQALGILGCDRTPDKTFFNRRGVTRVKRGQTGLYAFEDVERIALEMLPEGFPIADPVTGLKYSKALFTIPKEAIRTHSNGSASVTYWNIPSSVTTSMIGHDLGKKPTGTTIFWRHNLLDPETGKPWKLSSHQPRHLLNTLAQSKYLSQELIAFWSGRKSPGQNEWYNWLPQEAIIEAYTRMGDEAHIELKVEGPLHDKCQQRTKNEPISYEEALRQEFGAIHRTRYGQCRHDYSLTPCPKDKDCINCGENSLTKGDSRDISEAEMQVKLHTKAIRNCSKAVAAGEPGVQRWLDIHEHKRERWEMALGLLTDPKIQDGTIITLPPPRFPQTKTGLTMAIRDAEDALVKPATKANEHNVDPTSKTNASSTQLSLGDDFFEMDA